MTVDGQLPLFGEEPQPSAVVLPAGPRVVHCRKAPAGSFIYVGRPTVFGNPFPLTDPRDPVARAASIAAYRRYFAERVRADARFARAVLALRGWDLGCWCAPRDCHAQVILDWLAAHPLGWAA